MRKLTYIWNFIKSYKYVITLAVFGINIIFFDDNNLILRAKNKYEISRLKAEIAMYEENFDNTTRLLQELTENPETTEKIARKKYLMKKDNEDIFIFE